MDISAAVIAAVLIALLAAFTVVRAVRIVPQARARNTERLGRYHRTLQPGLNSSPTSTCRHCPSSLRAPAVPSS